MAATLDSERRRWQAKGYAIALEREGYVLLVKPKRLGGQRAVILEVTPPETCTAATAGA